MAVMPSYKKPMVNSLLMGMQQSGKNEFKMQVKQQMMSEQGIKARSQVQLGMNNYIAKGKS